MARITIGTQPTRIDVIGGKRIASGLYRCPTADLYLERSEANTTTAIGYLIPAGDTFGGDVMGVDKLFAVVGSGTAELYVLPSGTSA